MANRIINKEKIYSGNYALNIFDGVKIGTVITYSGDDIPRGFLRCDGSAVERGKYAELFKVIGTKFGEGDGSTTFGLPNIIDATDPKLFYLIKWNDEGASLNYATTEKSGFVRFATKEETEKGERDDVAITPKHFGDAFVKKSYEPEDCLKSITVNDEGLAEPAILYGIYGNEKAGAYATRADYVQAHIDKIKHLANRGLSTFDYVAFSTAAENPKGSSEYTMIEVKLVNPKSPQIVMLAYPQETNNSIYVCKCPLLGSAWTPWQKLVNNYIGDIEPKKITSLATGLTGEIWYQVKNNEVLISANNLVPNNGDQLYIINSFPTNLLPDKLSQVCNPITTYSASGKVGGLLYADHDALKFKSHTTGTMYGFLTYMLWER